MILLNRSRRIFDNLTMQLDQTNQKYMASQALQFPDGVSDADFRSLINNSTSMVVSEKNGEAHDKGDLGSRIEPSF